MFMEWHDWLRALHIMAVIAWMAGLFYLPRLFVYHAATRETALEETFKVMERRLYRAIMWPAMIASWVLGLMLIANIGLAHGWLHAKLLLVVLMTGYHLWLGAHLRRLAAGENRRSENFFRFINEIPTFLMIGIVILAVVKPF